jgi:hypothetical protein
MLLSKKFKPEIIIIKQFIGFWPAGQPVDPIKLITANIESAAGRIAVCKSRT